MAEAKKTKVTNTGCNAVFITNPYRVSKEKAEAEPGTPVHLLCRTYKLKPGESAEIDAKEASELKKIHGFIK